MKKVFIVILNILAIIIIYERPLNAIENNNKAKDEVYHLDGKVIQKKISEYLSSHSLQPYILSGALEMEMEGYLMTDDKEEDELLLRFLQVNLYQKNKSFKALFSIVTNKITRENNVDMVYLTNGTLISLTLFLDIIQSPPLKKIYPKVFHQYETKQVRVFMDVKESLGDEVQQQWVFFNPIKTFDVNVLLKSDDTGGAFFIVKESAKR